MIDLVRATFMRAIIFLRSYVKQNAMLFLRAAVPLIVFGGVLWLLHHEFREIRLADVRASFRSISSWAILTAIGLTCCNYIVMIGYDWLGVKLVQHPITLKQVTITSLLSYAFSNSLGVIFGGTPVRVRLYTAWGMSSPEIVRLVLFIGLAFWLGLLTLGGLLFVVTPFDIPARFNLPLATSRPLGAGMLAAVIVFFIVSALRRQPIHLWGVNLQPPPVKIALAQTLVAAFDFLLAAGVLYALMPTDLTIGFFPFVAIFLLAIVVALASHVPGGLGVLELVLITMLPQTSHGVVASLLAFRVIYYLMPLLIAIVAVSITLLRQHHDKTKQVATTAMQWSSMIGPRLITGGIFLAGLILLISGSLPAVEGRMDLIHDLLPLPIVELSHFFGSIAGAFLLILARGLQRRIDTAWGLTIALLAVGAVVSLAKGFDYEEAIVLTLLMLALIPCRKQFYRRGRLLSAKTSVGGAIAVLMSLGLLTWLVLFSYRHVEYSHELWWEFAVRGDAPRSLRALVGAAVVFLLVGVGRALRAHSIAPEITDENSLEEVARIVKTSKQSNANLALLGDKRFIFSDDRKAFVMFGCEGKSWVAMCDPVGPDTSADDAAWKFREACDEAGVWPVFYQVGESSLGRYIEMGLSMIKLGEAARVPLTNFSLQGSARKDLRYTNRKATESGLRFEIVPQASVAPIMPKLKFISDAWLGEKSSAEKGFSLGYFSETYLTRCDIALVIQNEQPIAFANLWKGADKHELSIDLMRYAPDAPHGVMEFLFIQLMLWGHQQGYEWFDLGMAPLSGVDSHRLGPLWNRLSSLIFQHGEQFYNFKGLRNYKNKFDPEWFPKYLASPGGLASPQILANVSTLISGGVRELFLRRAS